MWRHPFRSALVRCESGEGIHCLLARHDGYRRLPGNVVHWRGLVLGDGGSLLVWDFVDGAGAHHVELRWHLSPGAVDVGDYWLLDDHTILAIDRDGRGECLTLDAPDDGWVSPAYGVRHQAPVARAVRTGVLPCEFITRVYARDLPGESERMNKGLESLRAWALVP
jgi:hypothetical protein